MLSDVDRGLTFFSPSATPNVIDRPNAVRMDPALKPASDTALVAVEQLLSSTTHTAVRTTLRAFSR